MMSNEEEKRCPLCAEEMDWTDQQFKPCQCGYQVCVWCWHHIIDMAEKDQAEGRCPACRTVYEKQKIVAMQANCQRTVNKNTNRKTKPPKAKPKTIEVKKDLTNIRVIQRKMAYVIGLPLSLADEDLLQCKEYFGQYGKVTKVSLSRTAGGAIQQFLNDTCSVYITYSKEEEALRCISSVHGFVLEGRFLRASFGTAKYCHAWLKNMPCNNAACLYLHSIGADEDSFGKDEVAAVHTRSRVQEMVGAANIAAKRSGNVLPPPVGDLYNSMGLFPDKSTVRSPISDTASHGSVNITGDMTCSLPSKERGGIAVPQKMTTFVDIVGRSNSSGSEKDQNVLEDRTIFDLSSDLSSTTIGGDTHPAEPYSVPNLFKVSSSDCIRNGSLKNIPDEPLHEDSSLFDNGRSKDTYGSSQRAHFLDPSYTANVSEDSGNSALGYKRTHNLNDITLDSNAVNNRDYEDYLPIRNTVFSDACQDMFQSSTKSVRIYRSSNSFSNEEIVEHLRRIDDNYLTNDEENSALHAVERSIISNIMSIDFDSCEDSMTMATGLSEIPDETNVLRGSSWNSHNVEKSGYSFLKQDGFPSQMAGPVLPDFGYYNKEQNLFKPQYPVTRPQNLAPPGFSVPSRDPPPGFSTGERTGNLHRASSGSRLVNSSLSSTPPQPPSTGYSTRIDNADFFDPAILNWGKTKPTNGVKAPGFEMRPASAPQMSTFEEDAKLWLLMQQKFSACQESKFSQMFAPQTSVQQELGYTGNMGSGLYGLSSRVVDQHKNYDSSSFPRLSQNKYANGHISNTNGYMHGLNDVQHKGEVGMSELERNERLRVDKYYPGYGDLMFSSGDVYTRVFGL